MLRRIAPVVVITACWALFISPDFALSGAADERTGDYTLGEVVVKAKREGVESVGTVHEVKAEDIENKDARTLDEALELLPGAFVRTGGDGVPRVDMRGFRSRHVLLLLDGIPFNSASDGQFDPSIIATENIAKIKVSYGAHSVLYGQGGLGGVINIVTKKGKQGVRGEVLGEAGEQDRHLGQVTVSGAGEKANFFLGASGFESDGFRLSDDFDPTPLEDGGLRENSDKRRRNLFANVGFEPTEKSNIGLVVNYLKGDFGKPPATIDNTTDPVFGKKAKFERVEDYEGYSGHLSGSYEVADPLKLRGWVFINRLNEEDKRYDDNNYNAITKNGSFQENDKTTIKGGTLQTVSDFKSAGFLTLGLSLERQYFKSEGEQIVKNASSPIDVDKDVGVYSAAVEYEVSPFKDFGLVLGYGHYWFDKDEGNDDAGSFIVGAHYDILDNTRIRGSAARQIRFPSISQLYDTPNGGNLNLSTEKSYNYELGLEQGLPWNTRVTLVGFLEDVKDYIEKDSATNIYENNQKYRFQGFEVGATSRFIRSLFLRASYSHLDSQDRSPGSAKDDLQYRPKNKFVFEGKYSFYFGLSLYMNFWYVADQYDYSDTTPIQKIKINDYTIFNAKVDQTFFRDRLTVYVGADNLFDEDYEESYGYPQPGRTVYGGARFLF